MMDHGESRRALAVSACGGLTTAFPAAARHGTCSTRQPTAGWWFGSTAAAGMWDGGWPGGGAGCGRG